MKHLSSLLLLAAAGCAIHAGGYGGYSTSYGSSGIVYNPPTTPAPSPTAPVPVAAVTTTSAPAPGPLGSEVQGSDGTFGWRANGDDATFASANDALDRAGCRVDGAQPSETLAECSGGVHVLLRRDPSHVYRLCASGVDRAQCATTWSQIH